MITVIVPTSASALMPNPATTIHANVDTICPASNRRYRSFNRRARRRRCDQRPSVREALPRGLSPRSTHRRNAGRCRCFKRRNEITLLRVGQPTGWRCTGCHASSLSRSPVFSTAGAELGRTVCSCQITRSIAGNHLAWSMTRVESQLGVVR